MARFGFCAEAEIDKLRQEIISYGPGDTISSGDERVASLYPEKLVIYLVDVTGYIPGVVPVYLRRALLEQPTQEIIQQPRQGIDRQESSSVDKEIHLTDRISIISHHHVPGEGVSRQQVEEISEKVGCFVVVIGESGTSLSQFLLSDWVEPIRAITGLSPIFVILCDLGKKQVEDTIQQLIDNGVSDIFEVPYAEALSISEEVEKRGSDLQESSEQESAEPSYWLVLLKMLKQCLAEGDKRFHLEFGKIFGEMCKVPAYRKIYEHAWKYEASKRTEIVAKIRQDEEEKHLKHISDLKKRHLNDMRSRVEAWKKELEAKDEDIRNLKDIVQKSCRNSAEAMGDETDAATMYRVKEVVEGGDIRENVKHSQRLANVQNQIRDSSGDKQTRIEKALREEIRQMKLQREEAENQLAHHQSEKQKESEKALKQEISQLQLRRKELEQQLVNQNEVENTLKEKMRQLQFKEQEDRSKHEDTVAELTISLELKEQRIMDVKKEMEQKEAANRQEIEQLKAEHDEEKTRHQNEMHSMEEQLKKELDINCLNKERVKQMKKEMHKLRKKIQVESEIRSENKKKPQLPEWVPNIVPFVISKLQEDGKETSKPDLSDEMSKDHARSEPPNDDFAGILDKIADDLYDESTDSLGGQLGFIQGDIQRALMTNVKSNRVTSDGTRHMLRTWRRSVSREDERFELRRALEAAKLLAIADRYLPRDDVTLEKDDDQQVEGKFDNISHQGNSEGTVVEVVQQDLEYATRVSVKFTEETDGEKANREEVFQKSDMSDPNKNRRLSDPNAVPNETRIKGNNETNEVTELQEDVSAAKGEDGGREGKEREEEAWCSRGDERPSQTSGQDKMQHERDGACGKSEEGTHRLENLQILLASSNMRISDTVVACSKTTFTDVKADISDGVEGCTEKGERGSAETPDGSPHKDQETGSEAFEGTKLQVQRVSSSLAPNMNQCEAVDVPILETDGDREHFEEGCSTGSDKGCSQAVAQHVTQLEEGEADGRSEEGAECFQEVQTSFSQGAIEIVHRSGMAGEEDDRVGANGEEAGINTEIENLNKVLGEDIESDGGGDFVILEKEFNTQSVQKTEHPLTDKKLQYQGNFGMSTTDMEIEKCEAITEEAGTTQVSSTTQNDPKFSCICF